MPKCLTTASGLIKIKYEKHDIQAAFSGRAVDLRNTLAVGTKMSVTNFWKGDHLSISVVKHNVNPDLTQDVDFKVRLDKGGDAMVFAHVASNYFTLKGSTFCGQSASHVVFDKVVRPLLEKLFCPTCNLVCTSPVVYDDHMKGKKHASKMRAAQLAASEELAGQLECLVCDDGKAHKKKVAAQNVKGSDLRCDLCDVTSTDKDGHKRHMNGKRHKENVKDLKNSKKGK